MPAIRGTQCRSLPSSYRPRCQNAGRKRKVINHGNIIFRSSICIRSFWHTWYINKLRLWENASKFLRNHHLRFVLCSASQIYVGVFEKFYGLLRIHLWSFTKDSKWRRNDTAVSEKFCLNNTLTIQRQLLKAITLIDLKISLDYGNFCWAFYHTRNLFLLRLQKPAVSKPSRVYLRQRPNYLVSSDSLQKTSSSPIPSVLFCGRYVMHKWQYTEWVAQ